MIRTLVTPDNQDISIHIPADYVGRQVEVLLYAIDELNQTTAPIKKKPSDFRGKLNLTEDQYQDFQQHLKDIRNEWERDI